MYKSEEELKELFFYKIKMGEWHKHKRHCENIANFWFAMDSGLGQEKFITNYRILEDKPLKEQRVRVSMPDTPDVCNKIKTVYKEAYRRDVAYNITFKDNDSEAPKNVTERMNFYGTEEGIDEYLDKHCLEFNLRDPNAFHLISIYDFDNTKEKPFTFPINIMSATPRRIKTEVYGLQYDIQQTHPHWRDYEYYRNVLQYLMYDHQKDVILAGSDNKMTINVHYMVTPNVIYSLEESVGQDIGDGELIALTGNYIFRIVGQHNLGFVPAFQYGYIHDPVTGGEVFESILSPSKFKFLELIPKKSELDVIMLCHGFERQYVLVIKCDYRHDDTETTTFLSCKDGYLGGNPSSVCPSCHGTGKKRIQTSPQDLTTIEVKFEDIIGNELPDLNKYHTSIPIPIEVINLLTEKVEKLRLEIPLGVFNSNVFEKRELVAATATEIKQLYKNIANALDEFQKSRARAEKFIYETTAAYMDYTATFEKKYPSDHSYESVKEILEAIGLAKATNSPSGVIDNMYSKLLLRQTQNADEIAKIKVIEGHRPFSHATTDFAAAQLSLLSEDNPKKVLFNHFDEIVADIYENSSEVKFHNLKRKARKALLDEKIKEYTEKYVTQDPVIIDIQE